MSEVSQQERLSAIRGAWKTEKSYVREGKGTRDWSQAEQRQIIAKGRANGYEGHHMKSVKAYPKHAANPSNIQFLNRDEHINGAHRGNTQNATNGYYNPQTGIMHSFGNRNPQAPQSQSLSSPLTQRQQNLAIKREQVMKNAAQQAKAQNMKNSAKGATSNNSQPQRTQSTKTSNKGIERMRNQASVAQRSAQTSNKGIEAARSKTQQSKASSSSSQSSKSNNQGIKSYQNKASGQASSTPKSSSAGSTKSSSASTGSSKGSSKGR